MAHLEKLITINTHFFRLTLLNKLLEDGNTLVKRNQLPEAVQRYQYAVKRIPNNKDVTYKPLFDQLRIHLLLNLSRCKRKMTEYEEALDLATEVIKKNPMNYEALHSRAKTYHVTGNQTAALADLTDAVKVAPQNRELHKILINLKEEIRISEMKAKDDRHSVDQDFSSGVGSASEYSGEL